MTRSGYTDDCWDDLAAGRWRGRVASAIRGERGQAFLRELLKALDAMPEKRLIKEELVNGDQVCAIGSLGVQRGIDLTKVDPEDHKKLGEIFNIAPCLVAEVEFINDGDFEFDRSTPEVRWKKVRGWVAEQIK